MRKVISYLACSLDGKIADDKGGVEWLESIPVPEGEDYGYASFYENIDTTIMGMETYRQVRSFDLPFPYAGKDNIVLSRSVKMERDEYVRFHNGYPADLVRDLRSTPGLNIWLIGGARINSLFARHGLIDEIWIHVMPVILGKGIPLFDGLAAHIHVKNYLTKTYTNGVVELRMKFARQNMK